MQHNGGRKTLRFIAAASIGILLALSYIFMAGRPMVTKQIERNFKDQLEWFGYDAVIDGIEWLPVFAIKVEKISLTRSSTQPTRMHTAAGTLELRNCFAKLVWWDRHFSVKCNEVEVNLEPLQFVDHKNMKIAIVRSWLASQEHMESLARKFASFSIEFATNNLKVSGQSLGVFQLSDFKAREIDFQGTTSLLHCPKFAFTKYTDHYLMLCMDGQENGGWAVLTDGYMSLMDGM